MPVSETPMEPGAGGDRRPSVEEDLCRLEQVAASLEEHDFWFPASGPTARVKAALAVTAVGIAGIAVLSCLAIAGAVDSIIATVVALSAAACAAAGAACLVTATSRGASRRPYPAFALDPSGSLWCLVPKDSPAKIPVKFKAGERATMREMLSGKDSELSNAEMDLAIELLDAISDAKNGREHPLYEAFLVEDIDDMPGDPLESDELVLDFSDRISGNRQVISLDISQWREFAIWLASEWDKVDNDPWADRLEANWGSS